MGTFMEISPARSSAPVMAAAPFEIEKPQEQREIVHAVRALNKAELFGQNNELTFIIDRETRRPLVRIINRKTNEIVRQIPPEYALRMAEDMRREGF